MSNKDDETGKKMTMAVSPSMSMSDWSRKFYHSNTESWVSVKPPSPKNNQVGGDHYKYTTIQPIDYIRANDLGWEEANVVKLVTRHKNKGGRQDIEKAIHYLELLIEAEYPDDQ